MTAEDANLDKKEESSILPPDYDPFDPNVETPRGKLYAEGLELGEELKREKIKHLIGHLVGDKASARLGDTDSDDGSEYQYGVVLDPEEIKGVAELSENMQYVVWAIWAKTPQEAIKRYEAANLSELNLEGNEEKSTLAWTARIDDLEILD